MAWHGCLVGCSRTRVMCSTSRRLPCTGTCVLTTRWFRLLAGWVACVRACVRACLLAGRTQVRHSAEAAGRQFMAFMKVVYAIGGKHMTADDLLPVFIYVLVCTEPARLAAPVRLFSTLQSTAQRRRDSELDYYCTSLTLALIYIVQQQRDEVGRSVGRSVAVCVLSVCA